MHLGNRDFLNDMSTKYPGNFNGAKVLELGSLDLNGTARDHFSGCQYTGIDIVPGKDVDVVVAAKNTIFLPDQFDTLITMSMFEHDPTWKQSFAHNLQWLRSGGLLIACWGAEGNLHHGPEPWKPVPAQIMWNFTKTLPIRDVDMFLEGMRYTDDCPGAWDLVAWKV